MSVERTLSRILRDDDDASGQTIRQWHLSEADGFVRIGRREDSDFRDFLLLRVADVAQLCADLREIAHTPRPARPVKSGGPAAGGRARAAKLTPEERQQIARAAAHARWGHEKPSAKTREQGQSTIGGVG